MAEVAAGVLNTEPKAVLEARAEAVLVLQINLHPLYRQLLALQILVAVGEVETIRRHLLVRQVVQVS